MGSTSKDLLTNKLKEHLGARPDVYCDLKFFQAVTAQRTAASPPEIITINQKFGYQADGCFVAPSVIIEPDGRVMKNEDRPLRLERVELAAYLDLIVLEDEDELKALMSHVVEDFLYVNDPVVAGAILGHLGLSVTRRFLRLGNRFIVWIFGISGKGKSHGAKAGQNFVGDYETERRSTGAATYQTWRSTPYQIEKIGYHYSDAVYLVDDFKRSNFASENDYRRALGRCPIMG